MNNFEKLPRYEQEALLVEAIFEVYALGLMQSVAFGAKWVVTTILEEGHEMPVKIKS